MTRFGPGRLVLVVFGIGGLAPAPGPAQSAYRAARGETVIVPRESGFARADFAEISLALQFLIAAPDAAAGLAPYVSAAARKGQFDLFSAFDFNPGFEAGVLGFVQLGGNDHAPNAVSLRVGGANTQRKVYAFNEDSSTVTLTEPIEWDLVVVAGVTLRPTPPVLLGLGGSVRREWSSPGTVRAVEVCVGGAGTALPLCADRYPAPLEDYWAGQVRGDLIWSIAHVGTGPSRPAVALLGSASVDLGQEAPARLNLGTGLGVTTASFPGQPIVVLLVEMYDITDATGQALTVSDQLVTRVSLTIPFDVLFER